MKLRDLGVDLEHEEDAAVFYGSKLECEEEIVLLKMKQPGLIDCLMHDVVLD